MAKVKIFVNGTFDVVHVAHLRMFAYARSLGTELHVAIDSTRRIQELKGPSRPINSLEDRLEFLSHIKSIDSVSVFDTDEDLINTIKNYKPDIMVKGSDWRNGIIVGAEHVPKIEFFERIDGYSTTNIVNR